MDSKLHIYNASAGSGKTFTLAVEYIKTVIANPAAYRHILAVTFTNKSTAEMKQRILSRLCGIAQALPDSQSYFQQVQEAFPLWNETEIRRRAASALQLLIHDYSRFRVQTIDSFFQTVMRGMARELRLGANLQIDIDNDRAISEAVDSLIEGVDRQSPLLGWLLEYIQDHIDNDKGWRIRDEIKKFSRNIFQEVYLEKGGRLREQLNNPREVSEYRNALKKIKKQAEEKLQRYADAFFDVTVQHGLTATDFSQTTRGVYNYFTRLKNDTYTSDLVNSYVQACMESIEKWAPVKSPTRDVVVSLAAEKLQALLIACEETRQEAAPLINSCDLSLRYFYGLRLLNRIDEEINRQNEEQGRFLLSKTTALLDRMEVGDTSFVYEKTGSEINHILIDEFQDTSRMQWKNFRILLEEELSQGYGSLVVGDVKQAIYRWRNSDWAIFNNLQEENPHFPVLLHNLRFNYRSLPCIVQFNNRLFTFAREWVQQLYSRQFGEESIELNRAYREVEQKAAKQGEGGYLNLRFFEKQDYDEKVLQSMVETAVHCIESGISMNDITLLVRYNRDIPRIADAFNRMAPKYPIVSSEAFRMGSSDALLLLIHALRYLNNEEDTLSLVRLSLYAEEHLHTTGSAASPLTAERPQEWLPADFSENERQLLRSMPLYELTEKICAIFHLQEMPHQESYLFAFFDAVTEYLHNHAGDITSFLTYWEEELSSKNIPAGETAGIRISSIHKAKGLEFHTVLLPFCDWDLESAQHENLIWCTPEKEPFDRLGLVPIRYKSDMSSSIYQNEYKQEYLYQLVDNLNLLYVACTRASHNLFVWSKAEAGQKSAARLLTDALSHPIIEEAWDGERYLFEWGKLSLSPQKTKADDTDNPLLRTPVSLFLPMRSFTVSNRFRQSSQAAEFIHREQGETESDEENYIRQGELLHHLFATIGKAEELPTQIERLTEEGVIPPDRSKSISSLMQRALRHPQAQEWFSGKYRLFNECSILYREGGKLRTRRPDRVMTDGNRVIVVDFKCGTPRPEHENQVKEYMQLLTRMGYEQPRGYLWYIYNNLLEEVK